MLVRKFIKEKQELALNNDKEDSAVILLLCNILEIKSTELFKMLDLEMPLEKVDLFNEKFDLYLYHNKPIQYLINESCFYGYDFYVDENVLIPRFETEELVENLLYRYDEYFNGKKIRVADVATGSGCIGLTLLQEEPNMDLTLTDISESALKVAEYNAKRFNVKANFKLGDMLEPLEGKFDIIVSNPPYIPLTEEVMSLVKDNEPNIALYGGIDGLKFYHVLLKNCKKYLNDKAIVCFEHGYDKRIALENMIKEYLPEARFETLKDLEGKDRMTFIYIGL